MDIRKLVSSEEEQEEEEVINLMPEISTKLIKNVQFYMEFSNKIVQKLG